MDCYVANAPLRKRFTFVAGNDGLLHDGLVSDSTSKIEGMHPHCRGAIRPGFAWDRRPRKTSRGRRESRVRAAPAVSCAMENRKRTRAYRFSGGNPAFPARWVTVYSALSPVTGLSCHRRPRKVLLLANLTPASGRQDHTASPSAPPALVVRKAARPPHPTARS